MAVQTDLQDQKQVCGKHEWLYHNDSVYLHEESIKEEYYELKIRGKPSPGLRRKTLQLKCIPNGI